MYRIKLQYVTKNRASAAAYVDGGTPISPVPTSGSISWSDEPQSGTDTAELATCPALDHTTIFDRPGQLWPLVQHKRGN